MPCFAAIGFDHPPHSMPLRDKIRASHRSHVLLNDGNILMAGAMYDDDGNQCGTIYVFDAADANEVWQWLKAEPFYAEGVYASFQVVRWTPAMNRIERCEWPVGA